MPSNQFRFDESGNYFYCFIVAAYTIALLPCTYLFWPTSESRDSLETSKKKCLCLPCQNKRVLIRSAQSEKSFKKLFARLFFIIAWGVLLCLYYNLSFTDDGKLVRFDPFEILGVSPDASAPEIRKAYKKLSLTHHPDKGGDEKVFIKISKAYAALTDEVARKNFQEYGNPDGPEAMNFGIALPTWLVAKENKYLVIGFYAFLFLLVLPIAVGKWWYTTMRYSASSVLMITRHSYMAVFGQNNLVPLRQVISYLSKSYEFSNTFNKDISVRPSDNIELPPLIKQIPEFMIFKKAIVGAPYEVKARALIYAYLMRLNLNSDNLEKDKIYIIKRCPLLLNEMITCCTNLIGIFMDQMENGSKRNTAIDQLIQSMENCMELVPMIIQAIFETPPLTQLPHIDPILVKTLGSGGKSKTVVKTVVQLAALSDDKRRLALHSLSDEQYQDVVNVLATMPQLKITPTCQVADEEDDKIWPMTIITCSVLLERSPLCQPASLSGSPVVGSDAYYAAGVPGSNYSPRHVSKQVDSSAGGNASQAERTKDTPQADQMCSHLVHCPFFLNEKFEGWWIYVLDRKNKRIISPPSYISNLQSQLTVTIKFMAPQVPACYQFSVFVRSDSYVDFVFTENFRFTVDPLPDEIRRHMFSSFLKSSRQHMDDSFSDEGLEASETDSETNGEENLAVAALTRRKLKRHSEKHSHHNGDETSEYESEAERLLVEEGEKSSSLSMLEPVD